MKKKFNLFSVIIIALILIIFTISMLILKDTISPLFWFAIIFGISALSMSYNSRREKQFKKDFEDRKSARKARELEEKNRYI